MIKRGIFETGAKLWFHLHPMTPQIFYYSVTDCKMFIDSNDLQKIFGRSKDGSISATGFLIPKDAPFIRHRMLKRGRVGSSESWIGLTDREAGLRGENLIIALLKAGVFTELGTRVNRVQSQASQYASIDFYIGGIPAEGKTERVVSTNLFIQHSEGGHRPTLLLDGSERWSRMPSFTSEEDTVSEWKM